MRFQPSYQLHILEEESFHRDIQTANRELDQCRTEGFFEGCDGNRLYYEYFLAEDSRGAIVVVHGLSEFTHKFHELAWYFLHQGYDVFLYDQRCHGRSCRLTDRDDVIHVDKFTDYAQDLHLFVKNIVRPATDKPLYLYSHSMGGSVAALYLAEHPDIFQKAVLSAPMIEPLTGSVSPAFARFGLGIYLLFADKKQKFWGSREFNPEHKFEDTRDKSRARFEHFMKIRRAFPCYCTTPMSMGWVHQSVKLRPRLMKRRLLERIKTPILMICAEHDGVVSPEAQKAFAEKCAACRRVVLPDATHGMLNGSREDIEGHVTLVLDHFN